jgi:hypothetical protein
MTPTDARNLRHLASWGHLCRGDCYRLLDALEAAWEREADLRRELERGRGKRRRKGRDEGPRLPLEE